ncbi:uncharacterized protein LOC136042706 [Artemia franciscana]|uniref:uncharacterized protein LOC136042706 n=1 Tax=Artemia franciscana TaxID=6661 RepID=UPI0032DA1FD0
MMKVRFASLQSKLKMIVASAPTNEANNSKKDCFYYNLNDLVNYVAEHEILNICSDLNAKVGKSKKAQRRADGRCFLGTKATEAEAAASKDDNRAVCRITKEITEDFKKPATAIESKSGRLLTRKEEIDNRWKEYFHGILNFALPADPPDGRPLFQLDISTEAISIYDIETVLRKLKKGKAAGIDRMQPELLKYGVGVLAEPLHEVLMQIWDTEDIPTDWKKGYKLKLIKKGRVTDCNNWRGITLQSAGSEVLCQVLLNHIQTKVEAIFRDEQHGFRPSRSCADIIFILRIFIEDSNEWQTEIIMAFIEFQKTFVSVHRDLLRNVLRYYGFADKMVLFQLMIRT